MSVSRPVRLSDPVKRFVLLVAREAKIVEYGGQWRGANSGNLVSVDQRTLTAAFGRGLITIKVDMRRRKQHNVALTEIGQHVAANIAHTNMHHNVPFNHKPVITEEAQKLITELLDA